MGLLLLLGLGALLWRFWPQPAADAPFDCEFGYHDYEHLWNGQHRAFCCETAGRGCPEKTRVIHKVIHVPVVQPAHNHYVPVPVPSPPHIEYRTHVVRLPPKLIVHQDRGYDCDAGYSNWYFGWSSGKKSWCCDRQGRGCPGSWHGSYQLHTHVFSAGVGHQHGRIYDCGAGFSNWMQGWSDSKKDWCCHKESRGCVKFHCSAGNAAGL